MKVAQCDNCRQLGPNPPIGWVNAVVIDPPDSDGEGWAVRYIRSGGQQNWSNNLVGIFCTWQCVAEYAAARALLDDLKSGQA